MLARQGLFTESAYNVSVAPTTILSPPIDDRAVAKGTARSTLPFFGVLGLLLLSSMPDAMAPPVLRGLFVDRYGVSTAAAHWFMAVNLIGAVLAMPVMGMIRRRFSPASVIAMASVGSCALLGLMTLPIGFGATLGLRALEGVFDIMVIAVLFDVVGKSGKADERGRRFGFAGSVLLLALAAGLVTGGIIGQKQPTLALWAGSCACLIVAIAVFMLRTSINGLVRDCPAVNLIRTGRQHGRGVWPASMMLFGDRALAGVMTATIPLYLADVAALQPGMIGRLLGLPLLIMAFGAVPAGALADRIGHLQLRIIASLSYAATLAAVVFVDSTTPTSILFGVMTLLGVSGAALMPTAFAIGSSGGRGSVGMAHMHAGGNVGYFAGIAGAAMMLSLADDYGSVVLAFVCLHAGITAFTAVAAARD